jgi:hypothetical protein
MPVVAEIMVPLPPDLSQVDNGYETQGQAYNLRMPSLATDPLKIVNLDGQVFSWRPTELVYRGGDDVGAIHYDYLVGSSPVQLDPPTRRQVRYRRTFPAADDVFQALEEQVKHSTILFDRPRPPAVYITRQAEFGVTGIVTGVRLPIGLNETMLSGGFALRRPVARDMTGAECEGRYEVLDTTDGQQLITLFPVEWILSPDRVYPINLDPTVVTTSTNATATAYPNQRHTEAFKSNGYLWNMFHDGTNLVCRYSADGGGTWQTPTAGATIGAYRDGSVFIDANDYLHVVVETTGATAIYYLRGTPDAGRTGYNWSATLTIASATSVLFPDVVAHSEGTGWKAHVVWAYSTGTPNSYARYQRINITGAGVISLDGAMVTLGGDYVSSPASSPAIAIDAGKNLFVTWNAGAAAAGKGIRGKKGAYASGPSWTWGTEEAVTETVYAPSLQMGPCVLDSAGRLLVTLQDSSASHYIRVFRRSAAGAWSDISPTNQAGQHSTMVVDKSTDKVYLYYRNNGLKQLVYDGATWSAETTVDADSTADYPGARRDTAGNAIDVQYMTGSASPYTVKAYRLTLNQPPTSPDGLAPNGVGRDAATSITLTAVAHDDVGDYPTDAQWQITDGTTTWYVKADGTLAVAATWVPTGGGSFALSRQISAGQLVNGKSYQWRVMTRDQGGLTSPWSAYAVFTTTAPPITTIVAPANGVTLTGGKPTVTVSVSGSFGSARYRIYADNAAAPGAVLAEHAGVASTSKTIGYDPANNTYYWIGVQSTSPDGVVGAEAQVRVNVSYTPPLPPQNVSASGLIAQACVRLTWDRGMNPGNQNGSFGDAWRVRRRVKGAGSWGAPVDVANPDSSNVALVDCSVASRQVYEFQVTAVGNNGTESSGIIVEATVQFVVAWLIHPTDSTQNLMLYLTDANMAIDHPQTISDTEPLGATRKTRSTGNVLGGEFDLTIVADHRNPRTFNLAEQLRARKQLGTTWLLKLPGHPGPLMQSIPGRLFEISLGALREVTGATRTVITIPAVEVGDARD